MTTEDFSPQDEMTRWMYGVGFTRDDILSQVLKLGEEYQEALSAYLLGETDERFAEELTDVALVSIGMLSLLSVNFDDVAEGKMQQTWEKYNPTEVQFLMMQGLTREEALHTLKHRWNRSHGNSHIPNP